MSSRGHSRGPGWVNIFCQASRYKGSGHADMSYAGASNKSPEKLSSCQSHSFQTILAANYYHEDVDIFRHSSIEVFFCKSWVFFDNIFADNTMTRFRLK